MTILARACERIRLFYVSWWG